MEHHMKLIKSLALLVLSLGIVHPCFGHTFYVGGKDGWLLHPKETYNHWAERNRFQVNDTLVFKYKKGSDSVLVVNEEAYHNCNKTSAKQTLDEGDSVFKFKRSGPFFFISGHEDKCENGQKLIIVVLAVRNRVVPHTDASAAPPTPPPTKTPAAMAPSTIEQSTDNTTVSAPAPAANSAAASTVFGGSIGLIMGLGLGLVLNGF